MKHIMRYRFGGVCTEVLGGNPRLNLALHKYPVFITDPLKEVFDIR